MTCDLVIFDRACSSSSLRDWLLFDAFVRSVRTRSARLYTDELPTLLKDCFPAKTAPTMRTPEGSVVPETIAIAEKLATRPPRPVTGPQTPTPAPRRAFWLPGCTRASPPFAATAR